MQNIKLKKKKNPVLVVCSLRWPVDKQLYMLRGATITTLLLSYAVYSVVSDSCDPLDYSLPGSSVLGIFQARILEWVAISFSNTK